MEQAFFKIANLQIQYDRAENAVDDISLTLDKGGSLGIIGESGSGKTTLALALMGLLDKSATIRGKIIYNGQDLAKLSEIERKRYRWSHIAIAFQNSLDVLNPVMTVQEQIYECIEEHTELEVKQIYKKIDNLFETVGLDISWQNYFPHQLSGGIRQRVILAMALACDPEILIIDEPTSALDALAKQEIIELLARLQREKKFNLIVISHEIKTVLSLSTKLVVMYKGCIVEEGLTKDIINNPMHNYTRGLLNSSPDLNSYRDLWGIPDEQQNVILTGCTFYGRCNQRIDICKTTKPLLEYISIERKIACNQKGIITLLHGTGLSKSYNFKDVNLKVCENCNLDIRAGEVVALIGQSGSGKTTLASMLAGILEADSGEVVFKGTKILGNWGICKKNGIQIVFQDPYSSINENFIVENAIREPLDILQKNLTIDERKQLVIDTMKQVQLPSDANFLTRKCYTLSGGQRQRVALARALVMEPALLIADEITSMLDASTQANILRLLKGLQNKKGFAMLYITHDLAVVQKIADKVYVMHEGKIIEKGSAQNIFSKPIQSYTKQLVEEGYRGGTFY